MNGINKVWEEHLRDTDSANKNDWIKVEYEGVTKAGKAYRQEIQLFFKQLPVNHKAEQPAILASEPVFISNPTTELGKLSLLAHEIAKAGYTPFDTLSWEALIELSRMLQTSDSWVDFAFNHEIRDEVHKAFEKKAKMLDAKHNSTFYTGVWKAFSKS